MPRNRRCCNDDYETFFVYDCDYDRCDRRRPKSYPVILDANMAANTSSPLSADVVATMVFPVVGDHTPCCYNTGTGIFTIPRCMSGFYNLTTTVTFDATNATDGNVRLGFQVDGNPIGNYTAPIAGGTIQSFTYTRYKGLSECQEIRVVVLTNVSGVSVTADSHFGISRAHSC